MPRPTSRGWAGAHGAAWKGRAMVRRAWNDWHWAGSEADGLRVRLATEADLPVILAMLTHPSTLAAVGETEEEAKASLRRLWYEEPATSGLRHFVAEDAGRGAVAYLRLEYPFSQPQCLWLTFFLVAPDARGEGYGRRLMELLKSEARRSGCVKEFGMHTLASNVAAARLYESAGFRCIRREPWRTAAGDTSGRLTFCLRIPEEPSAPGDR